MGSFRKDSQDYEILTHFYERHREALGIERQDIERAVYSSEEKTTYPLLALFFDTVYDSVKEEDFAPRDRCEQCGKKQPWQRNGLTILRGEKYRRYSLFITVSNEFFVRQDFRHAVEAGGFQGAVYTPCFTPEGQPIEDYFLLGSKTHLGFPLTREGTSWICPLCHQIDLPAGQRYPPEYFYNKNCWSRDDLVLTEERPPLLCCSQPLAHLIFDLEPTITIDQSKPIVLI